jgi:hypothetical protein
VFLFEAPEVEWIVNDIVDDRIISAAFGPWQKVIDGTPRLAHERFYWSRDSSKLGVGLAAAAAGWETPHERAHSANQA